MWRRRLFVMRRPSTRPRRALDNAAACPEGACGGPSSPRLKSEHPSMSWRSVFGVVLAAVMMPAASAPVVAQDFPSRPITIVVGLAAGGVTDVTTRQYAEMVSQSIGQPIVIENRPGAGGAIAATAVQNA